jgi:hypothetical protein
MPAGCEEREASLRSKIYNLPALFLGRTAPALPCTFLQQIELSDFLWGSAVLSKSFPAISVHFQAVLLPLGAQKIFYVKSGASHGIRLFSSTSAFRIFKRAADWNRNTFSIFHVVLAKSSRRYFAFVSSRSVIYGRVECENVNAHHILQRRFNFTVQTLTSELAWR